MRITKVEPTELFTGTAAQPLQIVRVTVSGAASAGGAAAVTYPAGGAAEFPAGGGASAPGGSHVAVRIEGPAVTTPRPTVVGEPGPGEERVAEVAVMLAAPVTEGAHRRATVIARTADGHTASPRGLPRRAEAEAEIIVAVPGWTMWMVSHFHYDPVWWDTQGQFTESRLLLPDEKGEMPDFRTAFELVGLHLDMASRDPDYKFVLAETDYLKPYLDTHPERRAELRRLIGEGRVEIVGGNYNEANTNLTCAESTIRNAVYGIGYQRDVLGGDPATAWMLDVFGHDPSYPSLMAAAGLTSSAWARGPFHQWGPRGTIGDNTRMQFPSEFEWLSPDGRGLLTAYMPNHYGAGWVMQSRRSLAAAEQEAYAQFLSLKQVAATRNVLLPVGADHVIPCRWAAPIHRDWNKRYVWPRFVTALPREFFAAVRGDAARRGVVLTTQTRDMNPVYPGKDVSYIDTKQGQRAAETAVMDGERLATLAWRHGAAYPDAALDKAWRQLVFGAHHDAITGTESDQVYLDLLGGWREAYARGDAVRREAARYLAGLASTSPPPGSGADRAVVVFNTLAAARDGLVTVTLRCANPGTGWLELLDGDAVRVPALAEGAARHPDGTLAEVTLTFHASQVPALGYRTYWARPAAGPDPAAAVAGWSDATGTAIGNEAYLVEADPGRGGGLTRILDKRSGTELVTRESVAGELLVQDEYDYHPRWREGPWLLMPKGPGTGTAGVMAEVRAQRCPVGARLVATLALDDLRITQETLLWDGAARVDFRTHVDGSIGHDRLLRVRFPLNVPGALPVCETAAAVIGRPFGPVDTDVGQHWFTLDSPAYTWFGLSSAARVIVRTDGRAYAEAIGVAELITPDPPGEQRHNGCREAARGLLSALARQGVTATSSHADGPRYGAIDLDSNLPDVRIALGGPEQNQFTAAVLAAADPAYGKELERALGARGAAAVWVPAARSRGESFVPGADLRGVRDLPVLVVAGEDLAAAVGVVTAGLAAAEIEAVTPAGTADRPASADGAPALAGWSAALLNRGTPGCIITTEGVLNMSLMRSCSGWPSGVWIDEPKRTAPDGTSFSWQHWSHTFEYALVSGATGAGDWRDAGFVAAGQAYNHPLLCCGSTGVHPGALPAAASLLPIAFEGPGDVVLGALKPSGNPAATGWRCRAPGRPPAAGRADAITIRLRETAGRPARVRLRPPGPGRTPVSAWPGNLLEEQSGAPLAVEDENAVASLPPAGMVTLLAVPGADGTPGTRTEPAAGPTAADRAPEPAQPVFTRYWLHGKGPAPSGNMPVAVHVSPRRGAISADSDAVSLRVTVCAGPAPAGGTVGLDVPRGLLAAASGTGPGPLRYELPAGGYASWDVTVRSVAAPNGPPPGRYFVGARITDPAGQVLEDVAMIAVGERALPPLDTPLDDLLPLLVADSQATAGELDATIAPDGGLSLVPGERGAIVLRLANRARSQIRGEAQLVSPFGTWDAITPWSQGFIVAPGSVATMRFDVEVPPGSALARPGTQCWALVKVCYFGRVRYTAPVRVSIAGTPA